MERNDSWSASPQRVDRETPDGRLYSDGQIVGTALPVANLIAYSDPGTQISYLSLIVTTALDHLLSEIFACDTQTDRQRRTLL